MTLAPLMAASAVVQAHTAFAIAALVLGAAIFLLRKGTPLHRALGRVGVVAMVLTALTSFWIGVRWSPIHILSVVSLVSVTAALIFIRRRNIRGHRACMMGAWIGLAVAGAFTLLPTRIMHAVVFGG